MPSPYSKDLRERVVAAYESGAGDQVEVAHRFSVGEATVRRWWALKRKSGSVAPKTPAASRPYRRALDADGEAKPVQFRFFPQCRVPDNGHDKLAGSASGGDRQEPEFDRDWLTIPSQGRHFHHSPRVDEAAMPCCTILSEVRTVLLAQRHGNHDFQRLADRLIRRNAEQCLSGRIPEFDAPGINITHNDGFGDVVVELSKAKVHGLRKMRVRECIEAWLVHQHSSTCWSDRETSTDNCG